MSDAPQGIRALQEQRLLEITWPIGTVQRLPYRFLRGHCRCAACVDEHTGRRIVGVEDVSPEVRPEKLAVSGNYALKISWSDGHDTGLYAWDYLRTLSPDAPE